MVQISKKMNQGLIMREKFKNKIIEESAVIIISCFSIAATVVGTLYGVYLTNSHNSEMRKQDVKIKELEFKRNLYKDKIEKCNQFYKMVSELSRRYLELALMIEKSGFNNIVREEWDDIIDYDIKLRDESLVIFQNTPVYKKFIDFSDIIFSSLKKIKEASQSNRKKLLEDFIEEHTPSDVLSVIGDEKRRLKVLFLKPF